MGLADLHIHTIWSQDGTTSVEAVLRYVARSIDLDVIAITDHDRIEGALEAVALAPRLGLEVVPGSEISTADGHLLAFYIQERIPPGLSLVETIQWIGEQDGLCAVPHPLAHSPHSVQAPVLQAALQDPQVAKRMVGLETYNSSLFGRQSNESAERLADQLLLTKLGSSDAHVPWMIGTGATAFVGRTAADLRRALETGAVVRVRERARSRVHMLLDWSGRYLLRQVVNG
jgi:hypothetical protein